MSLLQAYESYHQSLSASDSDAVDLNWPGFAEGFEIAANCLLSDCKNQDSSSGTGYTITD